MIARFDLTPQANRQLAAVHALLAEQSEGRADRRVATLRAELEALRNFPRRCPVAADSHRYGGEIRELLFDRRSSGVSRIFYDVAGDVLPVVAIVHSPRG